MSVLHNQLNETLNGNPGLGDHISTLEAHSHRLPSVISSVYECMKEAFLIVLLCNSSESLPVYDFVAR